jgi:hypothetical protein
LENIDMPFFLGLDLGQAQDYTALMILEQFRPAPQKTSKPEPYQNPDMVALGYYTSPPRVPLVPAHYHARHLERFPLGTSYPTIITEIQARLKHQELADATLVVDATGVGRPCVDMFRAAGLKPVAIVITGGLTPSEVDGYHHVPKKELVSTLQVLMQSGRLKVAPELPDAAVLSRELSNFKVKISAAANETYAAWREADHDDLILAVTLAAWCAEHRPQRSMDPRPGSYFYTTY